MISELRPYPVMKHSSVPWLGDVPLHWDVLPNRALFSEVKERNQPDVDLLSVTITKGVIRQRDLLSDSSKKGSSNQDKSAYKVVRPGDIAYNKMRAWQGAVGVSEYAGIVSPAYVVERPRKGVDPRYVHYLLRTPAFAKEAERWSYGITSDMWSLRPEHFKMIYACLPPLPEQAAIVRFLDHTDGKIWCYIRNKQKLIKLLEEQKQASIHLAVTRGLISSAALRDSGIPWLGEIPTHWEARKLRSIASRVTKGTTPTTIGREFAESGIRFIKVESISNERSIIDAKCAYIDEVTDRLLKRSRLRAGDVVVSIAGAIGRPAVVPESMLPANTNQAVAIVSPLLFLCRSEWLAYCLSSPMCSRSMSESSVISAQANLSLANLGRTVIPLPPLHLQDEILKAISEDIGGIRASISAVVREISLLREYRTRLIIEVVTGKLDVREAAAHLPDIGQSHDVMEEWESDDDSECNEDKSQEAD
jgi:type I restriction enzyme S subunit